MALHGAEGDFFDCAFSGADADYGGGIAIYDSLVTLSGGSISSTTTSYGGGFFLGDGSVVTLAGVTID